MRRLALLALCAASLAAPVWAASSVYDLVRQGNQAFLAGQYPDALAAYQEAAKLEPSRPEIQLNIANTMLQQGDAAGAIKAYKGALGNATGAARSRGYYNLGGAQLAAQDFKGAVESLRQSLRLDPRDEDAKHNLLYAMNKLKEQQEQQQEQQNQDQEQQDQQNQDKSDQDKQDEQQQDENQEQQQDQDKQEQDKEQDQPQSEPTPQEQPEQQQQPQQAQQEQSQEADQPEAQTDQDQPLEPGQIDPDVAAAILDALQKDEQKELQLQMQKSQTNADVDQDW